MKIIRATLASALALFSPSSAPDNTSNAVAIVETMQQPVVVDVNITSPTIAVDFVDDVTSIVALHQIIVDDDNNNNNNYNSNGTKTTGTSSFFSDFTFTIENFILDMKTSMHKSICKAASHRDENGFVATLVYDKYHLCPRPNNKTKLQIVWDYIKDSLSTVLDVMAQKTSTIMETSWTTIEKVGDNIAKLYANVTTTTTTTTTTTSNSSTEIALYNKPTTVTSFPYTACNWINQKVHGLFMKMNNTWTAGEEDNELGVDSASTSTRSTTSLSCMQWTVIMLGGIVLVILLTFMERMCIRTYRYYNNPKLIKRRRQQGEPTLPFWEFFWNRCMLEKQMWEQAGLCKVATMLIKQKAAKALVSALGLYWCGFSYSRLLRVVVAVIMGTTHLDIAVTMVVWKFELPFYIHAIVSALCKLATNQALRGAIVAEVNGFEFHRYTQGITRPFTARWTVLGSNFLDYFTLSTIKRRYREFARIYHPDKFDESKHDGMTKEEAQALFQEYSAAYDYLTGKSD